VQILSTFSLLNELSSFTPPDFILANKDFQMHQAAVFAMGH